MKAAFARAILFPAHANSLKDGNKLRSKEVAIGNGRRDAFSAKALAIIVVLALTLGWPSEAAAYAVLTHEAVIDAAWNDNFRPLLLERFPDSAPEHL